jgi:hypothetical protein
MNWKNIHLKAAWFIHTFQSPLTQERNTKSPRARSGKIGINIFELPKPLRPEFFVPNSFTAISENEFRHQYYQEGQTLLIACRENALEEEQGLPAYLAYWTNALSHQHKLQLTFEVIPHIDALIEWFGLKQEDYISHHLQQYADNEIRAADINRWTKSILSFP